MAMTIRRTANRAATIKLAFTHQRYLFGATPLERRIGRIRTLFNLPEHERPPANLGEELDQLESRYELFKIDFFRFFLFGFSEAMHAVGHIGSLKFDRLRPLAAVLR